MFKKTTLFLLVVLLFQISLISAIDITIHEKEISSVAITDLNKPAIFQLTITNNEPEGDTFQVYSLVGQVTLLEPAVYIEGNSQKTIDLEVYPRDSMGYLSFEYKIKNSKDEIKSDSLAINIVNLGGAFNFDARDLVLGSDKVIMVLKNKAGYPLNDVQLKFSSVFFDYSETISFAANQEKQIIVPVNPEIIKQHLAGPYLVNAEIKIAGKEAELSTIMRFVEHSGIDTEEVNEGFLSIRNEITKTNLGNVPTEVEVIIKKNRFSALFTNLNIQPTNRDTIGFNKYYIFQKTLGPGESLKVITKTNWWLLILIILGAGLIIYMARKYSQTKLKVTKRVNFVKTKGGEFALKVSVMIKARDFVERIKIIDKLPGMVKLYERFGAISPDRIDEKNKRLEWDIENLQKGEERIFSYVIYSKMGVIGRFELPQAEAFYEYQGKLKEGTSNKAFYVNEPDKSKPYIQKMVDDLF